MTQPGAHSWTDDQLREAGLAFRSWTLPVSREPFRLGAGDLDLVRRRTESVSRAAELVVAAFPEDPAVRGLFAYRSLQEQCVLRDPGYRPLIPLGRWDSFLFPDGPRFMEYNTDGAAGWHYSDALTGLWRREEGLGGVPALLADRLLQTILHCFRQWDRRGVDHPRVALVDWAEVGTRPEQEALAARFAALGVPTELEDPRALRASEGRIAGARGTYDIVYRRLVSEEAFSRAQEIRPFLDAYLEGAACFVGSFRTDPAWHKALFVVLSDPAFSHLFPEELLPDLEAAIPWSRLLKPGAVSYRGAEWDMEALLLEHPADFVLKPTRSYEGRGVVAGAFAGEEAWRRAVVEGLTRGNTLVQSMLRPCPVLLEGMGRRFLQAGEYVLAGRLAGFLVRSSETPLITPDWPERYHPVAVEVPWSLGGEEPTP
jgi:hypothetical protein